MRFSYSRVECFKSCKFKYKLRYLDGIKTLPNTDANNALVLGTAIHEGIEKGVEAGIKAYCDAFPIIDDSHINEIMKLEYLIPKVQENLPEGIYEHQILGSDFIGYSDLLVPVEPNTFDLYDFKYSNNQRNYMESGQLHEYKYFIEKIHPSWKIRKLYFVFIPKVAIKQKKTEDLMTFRERIKEQLKQSVIEIVPVEYDPSKVIEFALKMKTILEAKEFPKEKSYFCNWCEFQQYCESNGEIDYDIIYPWERRAYEKR